MHLIFILPCAPPIICHASVPLLPSRPPSGVEASAMVEGDRKPNAAEKYGLVYVRGCEVRILTRICWDDLTTLRFEAAHTLVHILFPVNVQCMPFCLYASGCLREGSPVLTCVFLLQSALCLSLLKSSVHQYTSHCATHVSCPQLCRSLR